MDARPYLDELVGRVASVTGDNLVGVWLFGSAALGDFEARRSDLDVQAVVGEPLSPTQRRRLVSSLSHEALPCPAHRLEFVIYTRAGLADPAGPLPSLNLNTGAGIPTRDAPAERFWFTIDCAIGREHGIALAGPPPDAVFPVPRPALVRDALGRSLAWHWDHAPAAVAVAAACRARAWAHDGRWRSKAAAVQWAAGV